MSPQHDYSPFEFRLLNEFQRGLPLVPQPFARVAETLGCGEGEVISALGRLQDAGAISRVGAVFAPRSLGASTLAALSAPPERFEEVAAQVSRRPEVNHNYEREHDYNLWFVVTCPDEPALERTLADISTETGCPVISLPLVEEYHIDLGFDLVHGQKADVRRGRTARREPTPEERALGTALQPGLDLVPRPFARLAMKAGMDETAAIAQLEAWLAEGTVKRFGIVVRHHELGYTANAMVVFDVPDDEVDAAGLRLAREQGVTLCYRRRRHIPEWPFNLFCMVHGRSREEVVPIVEHLGRVAGHPGQPLFSLRRFKQRGARYFDASEKSCAA